MFVFLLSSRVLVAPADTDCSKFLMNNNDQSYPIR